MNIRVYQSGGIAGGEPVELGQLNTNELDAADRARVEDLVDTIQHPKEGTVPIGADLVEYRIEIRTDGHERSVVVPDDMDPNNPVLQSVQQLLGIIGGAS